MGMVQMVKSEVCKDGGIWEMVKMIFWVLLIVGVFCMLFFQLFWIFLGLMKDMLLIGDFLFVNKMVYGYLVVSCFFLVCLISGCILVLEFKCGDVVVFCYLMCGDDFIKWLIGLLGDCVQMCNGIFYINGEVVLQVFNGIFVEVQELQGLGESMFCLLQICLLENG